MKHLFIALAAGFAATFAAAQIPMPAWELSEAVERQSGVMNYTNEKFDFRRLPMHRSISEFLHPGDTCSTGRSFSTSLSATPGARSRNCASRVTRRSCAKKRIRSLSSLRTMSWLVSRRSAHCPRRIGRAGSACGGFAEGHPHDYRRHGHSPGQTVRMSYALQYLFRQGGNDAEPLLSWQTYLSSDKAAELSAIAANLSGRCVSAGY
ncbi:MAG: hypothetical protein ACLT1W_07795 [Alistipes onderdonkii]